MASQPPPPDGRAAADILDLLAEALLVRIDDALGERAEAAAPQAATTAGHPSWLRVSEVARRVGASERTVYRALRSGALAGERLGAHWRIRPESVQAWLADPRPPRPAAIAAPDPPPKRPGPRVMPETTYLRRARQRGTPRAQPTTSRGSAARKEQR